MSNLRRIQAMISKELFAEVVCEIESNDISISGVMREALKDRYKPDFEKDIAAEYDLKKDFKIFIDACLNGKPMIDGNGEFWEEGASDLTLSQFSARWPWSVCKFEALTPGYWLCRVKQPGGDWIQCALKRTAGDLWVNDFGPSLDERYKIVPVHKLTEEK